MGIITGEQGKLLQSYVYMQEAKKNDPYCGADENLVWLYEAMDKVILEKEIKLAQAQRRNEIVKQVVGIVTDVGTTVLTTMQDNSNEISSSFNETDNHSSGNRNNRASITKVSANELVSKNNDSRTYSKCESELSKMESGLVSFNSSIKAEHQRIMK